MIRMIMTLMADKSVKSKYLEYQHMLFDYAIMIW